MVLPKYSKSKQSPHYARCGASTPPEQGDANSHSVPAHRTIPAPARPLTAKNVFSYISGPTKPFSLNPFAEYPLNAGENQMEEKVKSMDPFRNRFREIPQGRNNPFTGNPLHRGELPVLSQCCKVGRSNLMLSGSKRKPRLLGIYTS